MSKINNLVAGLAGDIVKTPCKKHFIGAHVQNNESLYQAALAGDIIGNTLYYSLIGAGNPKYLQPKVTMMGLSAGIGAVTLPDPMGLDPEPVAKNNQIKTLTIGYYLLDAVVTGLVLTMMKKL